MDWSLGPHHPRESQSEQPHLLLSESVAVFLLQMPLFRLKENRGECENVNAVSRGCGLQCVRGMTAS